jgi:hypothetical protein
MVEQTEDFDISQYKLTDFDVSNFTETVPPPIPKNEKKGFF